MTLPAKYWQDVLEEMGLADAKSVKTPAELRGDVEPDSPRLSKEQHAVYRRLVGKLMYAVNLRVDLAYIAKELARHV